jgi:hypothetical protein
MTMASKKSTTKTKAGFNVKTVNGELIDALRTLAAAGVLEEEENGWSYRIPAHVAFPGDNGALTHWPSGAKI